MNSHTHARLTAKGRALLVIRVLHQQNGTSQAALYACTTPKVPVPTLDEEIGCTSKRALLRMSDSARAQSTLSKSL